MKKILIIIVMFSFACVSCTTKDSKNLLNLDEVEEALYVIQSEVNYISSLSEPEIYYLIYAGYKDNFYPSVKDNNLSGSIDFIQSHIFYKHTYLFVVRTKDGVPVVTLEPISSYQNAGEYSQVQSSYLLNIFRNLNKKFAELKKTGKTDDLKYDDFLISLKLDNGKVKMQSTRFLPDGSISKPVYCEENRIKDDIKMYTKHIDECLKSLEYYEELAAAKKQLLKNSEFYAEYVKRKAEHLKSQGLIMSIYDSAPFRKIEQIIVNNPDILENADLYTKENLQNTRDAIKDAESNIEMYKSLIEEDKKLIDNLQLRLDQILN